MSLVDDGKIGFTDRVHQHLPGFEAGGKGEITVDDLLSHAGGFRWFDGPGPYLESYERFLCRAMAAELEPGWQPGVDQGYHQETAWYVLAALVEAKLKVPYPQAVSELVCAPLGMRSTWVSMAQPTYHQVRHDLVVPRYTWNGAARRVPFLTTAAASRTRCPPYDGYGTIDDLAGCYEACLGALRPDQPFPVSAPTLRLMVSSPRGWAHDRTSDRACEYGRAFFRNLSGAWGSASAGRPRRSASPASWVVWSPEPTQLPEWSSLPRSVRSQPDARS
jgi:CubicO group peptidase (beta-lactamase class C family)